LQNSADLERELGLRYAKVLKDHSPDVYKDCKEVIDASLAVMGFYNRVAMNLRSKFATPNMARQPVRNGQ
jgi:hypothetical protein